MKFLFVFIMVLFCSYAYADQCEQAYKAGFEKERRMIITKKDGTNFLLTNIGEYNIRGKYRVLNEVIEDCGIITQLIDTKKDGACDALLIWKPIVYSKYEVLYSFVGKRKCNFI